MVARVELAVKLLRCEVKVRPHGAVWHHDTFGEASRTRCVIDEREFFRRLLFVVADVFLSEMLGVSLPEQAVEVLAGIGKLLGARHHE